MNATMKDFSGYIVVKRCEGSYEIQDGDGDRVVRVATFYPGPMVLVEGQTIMSPDMARATAWAMTRLAKEIAGLLAPDDVS